jgi:hypothetical protein
LGSGGCGSGEGGGGDRPLQIKQSFCVSGGLKKG